MQHIGTVYLSRQPPQANTSSAGDFTLQITAYDRINPRQCEAWRLIWAGPQAQAFWQAHRHHLRPGAALSVTCTSARIHTLRSRPPVSEIQAHIVQAAITATDNPTQPA